MTPRENFSPSPYVAINPMKSKIFLVAGPFLLAAAIVLSRDQRANLLPKLQPGQSLTYLIRYRAEKNVKTPYPWLPIPRRWTPTVCCESKF
ncbi:MAG: hypothetical protein AUH86_18605 [Acidobacteria bacterium 13_1_40CM_4_58_4]|nr:MAG: hypothetical protein AUH86_18605 [Acidobacteria bacterium 13_1_40CM_4_58_4]